MPEPGQLRRRSRRAATARHGACSAPSAASDCQSRSAPIQPSLSWTAVTPLVGATRRPSRIAPRYSSSGMWMCRSRNRQQASSRRTPVASPRASRSTTPPSTSRSPSDQERAAELIHRECESWASSATGTSPATSSSASFVGVSATPHPASHARAANRLRAPTRAGPARGRLPPPPTRRPPAEPPVERSPTSGSGHAHPKSPGRRSARRDRHGRGSAAPPRAFRPRPRSGRPRSRARTQSGATAPASARRLARESWTRI